MISTKSTSTTLLWSTIFGLTAALGSYGLACVFPFAGLAALAAITLPTRHAVTTIAAVWAVNQVIGFTLLDYAQGDQAVIWGGIIGAAAFVALAASKLASGNEARLVSVRGLAALAASIAVYQAVMFVGAYVLDGFASSTLEIVATVARNDVLWFAGLAALYLALTTALPRWFGPTNALRTA